MAPVEFEKKLEKAFRARKIQPSAAAWEKLEARLDAAREGRRQNKSYRFLLVAASLIVLIGLPLYFGLFTEKAMEQSVVASPEVKIDREQPQKTTEEPIKETFSEGLATTPRKEKEERASQVETPGPIQKQELSQGVALGEGPSPEAVLKVAVSAPGINGLDEMITRQVDAVLAQVEGMEAVAGEVSDAEIDSLLREAQAQISVQRQVNPETVDAMALLAEAETEMDQTFREQLFIKLKNGFNKVRTAVADRNN